MIEFVLVACLGAQPDECRTEKRLFSDMTLIQCVTGSQILAADWGARHPEWTIRRHLCRVFDPKRAEI